MDHAEPKIEKAAESLVETFGTEAAEIAETFSRKTSDGSPNSPSAIWSRIARKAHDIIARMRARTAAVHEPVPLPIGDLHPYLITSDTRPCQIMLPATLVIEVEEGLARFSEHDDAVLAGALLRCMRGEYEGDE